jgi:ubiquinone/menaquinone biosynthesis C-methylase UbiE
MDSTKRVLEFGCGAGRMLRHIPTFAPDTECWGADISAPLIRWCRHNLQPSLNFTLSTTVPHLPFEDQYFDLIYCGSVFTHIEDLEVSWLLELGRVLAPSGYLYLTIHDQHTVHLLGTTRKDHWLARSMAESRTYVTHSGDFSMIVVGRGDRSQVFYHSEYFKSLVPRMFQWLAHVPEAYGYQSAVVLKKP